MPAARYPDVIEAVCDSAVPWPIKGTLIVLASHHPNIWPSQDRLARQRGISRRQLNRHLATLEEHGLIARKRRTNTSTAYTLRLRAIRAYTETQQAGEPHPPVDEPPRKRTPGSGGDFPF